MQKIGVTGQSGFIGTHVFNTLGLYKDKFERVDFDKKYFDNETLLDEFVANCDVIVHLAGMNRHADAEIIYKTNIELAEKLVASLRRTNKKSHIIFSSSTQEEKDNLYGRSKKQARLLLSKWASKSNGKFSGLIIPNVYGSFGTPYYNSVIATFCYQLTHNEIPRIDVDGELKLIYVGELADAIIKISESDTAISEHNIPNTAAVKVSEILGILMRFKENYLEHGMIPEIKNELELNLFNTFRSYVDIEKTFPVKLIVHTDTRGSFSEIIRLGNDINGQISFSTTLPGATRGNHFHTRKIERFTVIKGKALIQLKKVGTDKVIDLYLSGDEPSYVDMPVWTIHNIKNIGSDELYTIFWINELYNSEDPDTFFETI